MTMDDARGPRILFCIPIFDDWTSAKLLLPGIAEVARAEGWAAEVLFIDDGSIEDWSETLSARPRRIIRLDVLELRRNLGHQRAIAVGLAYVFENRPCDVVVVMDGDGEDTPQSVPDLVARVPETGGRGIVFAKRELDAELHLGHRCVSPAGRLCRPRAVQAPRGKHLHERG
ncbi:MAG: glycosyltransferase [Gemmatimonadota bacterium]|nr:glycosyltransferase [Gemmatimonadota bacterium]